jgi:hypothetical protein
MKNKQEPMGYYTYLNHMAAILTWVIWLLYSPESYGCYTHLSHIWSIMCILMYNIPPSCSDWYTIWIHRHTLCIFNLNKFESLQRCKTFIEMPEQYAFNILPMSGHVFVLWVWRMQWVVMCLCYGYDGCRFFIFLWLFY